MIDLPPLPLLVAMAAAASGLGAVGGLGGAMLLVPALLLVGVDPLVAAPLGAVAVATSSTAAAPRQLAEGVVHHRIGVVVELVAASTAVLGALAGAVVAPDLVRWVLVVTATGAAVLSFRRSSMRAQPEPLFAAESAGEWPGTLGGAYRRGGTFGRGGDIVPYQAQRLAPGLTAMAGVGLLAGLSGVGGGFLKTPILREVMGVPIKVAAATALFASGITAAVTLIVFVGQDRVVGTAAAAVIVGSLVGGTGGAEVARRLPPQVTRRVIAVLLLVVAAALAVQG